MFMLGYVSGIFRETLSYRRKGSVSIILMLVGVQFYLVISLTSNNVYIRKLTRNLIEKLRLIQFEKTIIIHNTNKLILGIFQKQVNVLIEVIVRKMLLVLMDMCYFPNPLQKNTVIRTFNRDGSGFITILLKFSGLYDVIAIDRYLSNITKKSALRVT